MLLRRVIGDVLRARRQGQHRTLREVSTAANVSLGYLSEVERGQKEASSELLAAICEALGSQLSEVLRDVSDTMALVEQADAVLADAPAGQPEPVEAGSDPRPARAGTKTGPKREAPPAETVVPAAAPAPVAAPVPAAVPAPAADQGHTVSDGTVSVRVRRDGPLRTTLHAVRNRDLDPARLGSLRQSG